MYDVAIVGSGIGGSYLASLLDDLKVLVVEKDKKVLPKDSGIVSSRFLDFFRSKALIKNRITRMNIVSPSGSRIAVRTSKPFAYILKRELFLEYLRSRAMRKAEFANGFVTSVVRQDGHWLVRSATGEHQARLVVGCDGANSFVRKSLGIPDPKMVYGLMVRSGQVMEGDIEVFFHKYFSPDFFSWVIPQNDEYGLVSSIRPNDYLQYFKKKRNLPEGTVYGYPICLGTTKSFSDSALLIGDACGQSKPITGGGIVFSLTAARYAAETIQAAFDSGRTDESFLSSYEKKWKKDYGAEIRKQLLFRRIYRWLSNKDVERLFRNFGPALEDLDEFDYDKFTDSWKKMPKLALASFMISSLPLLFRKEIS